jgi:hypothetical protein
VPESDVAKRLGLRRVIGAGLLLVGVAFFTHSITSASPRGAMNYYPTRGHPSWPSAAPLLFPGQRNVGTDHACPIWPAFCQQRQSCVDHYHGGDPLAPVSSNLITEYSQDCANYCLECDCPGDNYCESFLHMNCETGDCMEFPVPEFTHHTNVTNPTTTSECQWTGAGVYTQSNKLYPACPVGYTLYDVDQGGFCCNVGADGVGCVAGSEGAGAEGADDEICAVFNNPMDSYTTCTYNNTETQICAMAYGQSIWTNVDFSMYMTYDGDHAGPFVNMVDPTDENSARYWLRFGDAFGLYKFDGANSAEPLAVIGAGPAPIARWTFDEDLTDSIGSLDFADVVGTSVIDTTLGALVVDGSNVLHTNGETDELGPVTMTAKTMCTTTSLATLDQVAGVSVMSIETVSPHAFDAIVFEERQANKWMAGSDYFERTQDLNGPNLQETTAGGPVHLCIVYGGENSPNRIEIFRNGVSQGSYEHGTAHTFAANAWGVTIGVRHKSGSNWGALPKYDGKIFDMELYDTALTAEQVADVYAGTANQNVYPPGATYHVRLRSTYEEHGWDYAHVGGFCHNAAGQYLASDGTTKILTQAQCALTEVGGATGTISGTTISGSLSGTDQAGVLATNADGAWTITFDDSTYWTLTQGVAQRIQAWVDDAHVVDVSDNTLGAGAAGFATYHASMQVFGVKLHDHNTPSVPKYGQMTGAFTGNALFSIYLNGADYAVDVSADAVQSVRTMTREFRSLAVKVHSPPVEQAIDYIQLQYAGVTSGYCAGFYSATSTDRGCSGTPVVCQSNVNSDLTLQVCDPLDDYQHFYLEAVDASNWMLHSKADSSRCVYVGTSTAHSDCEPFTLMPCDSADTRFYFQKEDYDGSIVWRNPATSRAIDVNSYANTIDNWIWACSGSNSAKKFDEVVSHFAYGEQGANECPTETPQSQTVVDSSACLAIVQSLLPEGATQGRTTLVEGSWTHVPRACSVQSGGDWAAHYNNYVHGSNDGGYSPVCSYPPAPAPDPNAPAVGTCADGDVQPAGGATVTQNEQFYPEVMYNGEWWPLCGHYFWDDNDGATTMCQQLGFTSGYRTDTRTHFDKDSMPVGRCSAGQPITACTQGGNGWGDFSYNGNWCAQGATYGGNGIGVTITCTGGVESSSGSCADESPEGNNGGEEVTEMAFTGALRSSSPDSLGAVPTSDAIVTSSSVGYTSVSTSQECGAGAADGAWDRAEGSGMSESQCRQWCTDTGSGCVGFSMGIKADNTNLDSCRIHLSDGALPYLAGTYIGGGTEEVQVDNSGVTVTDFTAGPTEERAAAVAFDGTTGYSVNNGWVYEGPGATEAAPVIVSIDVGSAYSLNKIKMYAEPGGTHYDRIPKRMNVYTSADGTTWTLGEAISFPALSASNLETEVTFTSPLAASQYFKFETVEGWNTGITVFTEIQMFGTTGPVYDGSLGTATSEAVVEGDDADWNCFGKSVGTSGNWMCTTEATSDQYGRLWYQEGFTVPSTWQAAVPIASTTHAHPDADGSYIGLLTTLTDDTSTVQATGDLFCKYNEPSHLACGDGFDLNHYGIWSGGTAQTAGMTADACHDACRDDTTCLAYSHYDDNAQPSECQIYTATDGTVTADGFGVACLKFIPGDGPELIVGGGFESPTASVWTQAYSTSANSAMPEGWTITSGNVDWGAYITGGHCTGTCSSEGTQQIDLCGGSAGAISQTVDTTEGTSYRLTFDYNAHGSCGSTTKTTDLSVDGTVLATVTKDRCNGWTGYANCWSSAEYQVDATAATTTIAFSAVDNSCGCMTLDNVSLKEMGAR